MPKSVKIENFSKKRLIDTMKKIIKDKKAKKAVVLGKKGLANKIGKTVTIKYFLI